MDLKSFFKLYTMPILALVVGFGLYYMVFVATNKDISVSNPIYPVQGTKEESDLSNTPMLSLSNDDSTEAQTQENSVEIPNVISEKSLQSTPSLTSSDKNFYVVIPKTLNIRDKPNTSSAINARLSQNQKIEVETIEGDWAKVQQGWVLLSLLKPEEPDISNPDESRFYIVIPQVINIRLEPNTSSKIINRLPVNSIIEVQYIKNGWAKLKNGWVLATLIKKQDNH
ncbi:SH3 domain-containing protein [Helicobacter sp. 13S00477-4]|uniref:SH3 domain-containing protein n=1 Tax=Helicobacter sp. 13S00477-4 TaxID=1905759 RepID=UPI000BA51EE5|nr:SH3 domain-containing protein [Helicobacter sp. 13S00477-4]